MKKYGKTIGKILAAALTTLCIHGTNVFALDNGIYPFVAYEIDSGFEEKHYIFGGQPLDELVGKRGTENFFKIGLGTPHKWEKTGGNAYLLMWKSPSANGEIGFGIGGAFKRRLGNSDFHFILSGDIGYGWQNVKGHSIDLSTNANKLGYILGKHIDKGPRGTFKGRFLEDTAIIRINLGLGISYWVTKNVTFDLKYKLSNLHYDISYYVEGIDSLNSITPGTYAHSAALQLGIHF